jgi:hypothetical protein
MQCETLQASAPKPRIEPAPANPQAECNPPPPAGRGRQFCGHRFGMDRRPDERPPVGTRNCFDPLTIMPGPKLACG